MDPKETEKIGKYQDLARELKKLWNMTIEVIPVVRGMIGTPPQNMKEQLGIKIGIETMIVDLQKTAIIYSARILRRVVRSLTGTMPQEKTEFSWTTSKCNTKI